MGSYIQGRVEAATQWLEVNKKDVSDVVYKAGAVLAILGGMLFITGLIHKGATVDRLFNKARTFPEGSGMYNQTLIVANAALRKLFYNVVFPGLLMGLAGGATIIASAAINPEGRREEQEEVPMVNLVSIELPNVDYTPGAAN